MNRERAEAILTSIEQWLDARQEKAKWDKTSYDEFYKEQKEADDACGKSRNEVLDLLLPLS